jgi:TIR domain
MSSEREDRAWIFVSHASEDLKMVRKVRNYLEDKDAGPLLFHLRALTEPEEFWPLIKREIEVRSFFLYCESPAAEESPWVRRERDAVEAARKDNPKRIGRVRVDGADIDHHYLDYFLTTTRVFASYAGSDAEATKPFFSALKSAGFSVFSYRDIDAVGPGNDFTQRLERELRQAAKEGWIECNTFLHGTCRPRSELAPLSGRPAALCVLFHPTKP